MRLIDWSIRLLFIYGVITWDDLSGAGQIWLVLLGAVQAIHLMLGLRVLYWRHRLRVERRLYAEDLGVTRKQESQIAVLHAEKIVLDEALRITRGDGTDGS